MDRDVRASTGHAFTSSPNPRAVTVRTGPKATACWVRCHVVSPTRTSPGEAASWRRAAMFTAAPDTRN